MSGLHELPERVFRLIESGVVAEFSTVSAAGVPIDTPTYYFPSDDMETLDLATGLPNPAKAERARRNPKVGLLIEGTADEPIVVVRAHAAVRDSDIQSNAMRYLAETGYRGISHGITWEKARLAVTYWSRIIIENKPERIYWWDNQAALDSPPQVWNAAPGTVYPRSDPPPSGKMQPSAWPVRAWQVVAKDAVDSGAASHLSVLDTDGYPLPMRARSFDLVRDGFRLVMPKGTPWKLAGQGVTDLRGLPYLCRRRGAGKWRHHPFAGRAVATPASVDARHQTGAAAERGYAGESPGTAGVRGPAARSIASGHPARAAATHSHCDDPTGTHRERVADHRTLEGTRQSNDLRPQSPPAQRRAPVERPSRALCRDRGAAPHPNHGFDHAVLAHAIPRRYDRQRRTAAHSGLGIRHTGPNIVGAHVVHHRRRDHDTLERVAGGQNRPHACSSFRSPASPWHRCSAGWHNRFRRSYWRGCCREYAGPHWSPCRRPRCSISILRHGTHVPWLFGSWA